MAAQKDLPEIIKILIKHKIDPFKLDASGKTALDYAPEEKECHEALCNYQKELRKVLGLEEH